MRSRLQDTAPFRLPQNLLATFLLSEWQTGRWPGASVPHASSSEPLARAAFGRLPMRRETTRPSKQSMTGLRYESESESESDPFLLAS